MPYTVEAWGRKPVRFGSSAQVASHLGALKRQGYDPADAYRGLCEHCLADLGRRYNSADSASKELSQ